MKTATALLAFALALAAATAPAVAATKRLIIGTGGVTGVYYAAGQAICRLVNREQKKNLIRCRAVATPGSTSNLVQLRSGALDMAIVQSDWQHHAWKGDSRFRKAGPDRKLRSVLSLHREAFTLIVRPDSGIARFHDIRGRRINAGNRGSGHRATVAALFRALHWRFSDFRTVLEEPTATQSQALCDDRVDALLFTVGHPNHSVAEAISTCKARLVPVTGPEIERVISETPYLDPTVIRAGLYRGQKEDVLTFGTTATLVTSADLLEETVYDTAKAVFGSLRALRRSHPALDGLDPGRMVSDGIIAPLHRGAQRYYREKRLLRQEAK
jgi:hypothetical protein